MLHWHVPDWLVAPSNLPSQWEIDKVMIAYDLAKNNEITCRSRERCRKYTEQEQVQLFAEAAEFLKEIRNGTIEP